MDKKKIEFIAVGLLAVIFAVIFGRNAIIVRGKLAVMETGSNLSPAEVSASPTEPDAGKKSPAVRDIGWGRDPFVLEESPKAAENGPANLRLMGITANMNTKKPVAIINNEMVSVDSRIGNFKVVRIQKDSVTVSDGDKEYVLNME